MIITIDGPAGAGKSTVARALARRLGCVCLNSGYIYRALTYLVLENGGDFDDRALVQGLIDRLDLRFVEELPRVSPDESRCAESRCAETAGRTRVTICDRDITDALKQPEITAQVYRIANDPDYRSRLIEFQRRYGRGGDLVAEGRDMGSVIFRDAELKFFLDASLEERARRQHLELITAGGRATMDEVRAGIRQRDAHDTGRAHAPLVVPDGATVVATDGLSPAEVVTRIWSFVEAGAGRRTVHLAGEREAR